MMYQVVVQCKTKNHFKHKYYYWEMQHWVKRSDVT